jgi:hypothetical protein
LQLQTQLAGTLRSRSGYQVSIPAGGDEVVVQLNNVEVFRINLGTPMKIKTPGDFVIEAGSITLRADRSLIVQSGATMDLKAGSSLALSGASTVTARAGATFYITGSTVNVNGGALEVT